MRGSRWGPTRTRWRRISASTAARLSGSWGGAPAITVSWPKQTPFMQPGGPPDESGQNRDAWRTRGAAADRASDPETGPRAGAGGHRSRGRELHRYLSAERIVSAPAPRRAG